MTGGLLVSRRFLSLPLTILRETLTAEDNFLFGMRFGQFHFKKALAHGIAAAGEHWRSDIDRGDVGGSIWHPFPRPVYVPVQVSDRAIGLGEQLGQCRCVLQSVAGGFFGKLRGCSNGVMTEDEDGLIGGDRVQRLFQASSLLRSKFTAGVEGIGPCRIESDDLVLGTECFRLRPFITGPWAKGGFKEALSLRSVGVTIVVSWDDEGAFSWLDRLNEFRPSLAGSAKLAGQGGRDEVARAEKRVRFPLDDSVSQARPKRGLEMASAMEPEIRLAEEPF